MSTASAAPHLSPAEAMMTIRKALTLILLFSLALAAPVRVFAQTPQKWALVIGIDHYKDRNRINDLSSSGQDARALKRALIEAAGVPEEHITLLISDAQTNAGEQQKLPTRSIILNALGKLARAVQSGDTVFLFFSGHGIEIGGKSYLLPYDTDALDEELLAQTGIETAMLQERIKSIPAGLIVLALDMCRSSPLKNGKAGIDPPTPLTTAQARGMDFEILSSPGTTSGPRAVATLFSCSEGQRSFEWIEKRRSYFAYYLEQGLRGGAADKEGQVHLNGLLDYIRRTVASAVQSNESAVQVPKIELRGATTASSALLARKVATVAVVKPVKSVKLIPKRPTAVALTLNSDWRAAANERIEWYCKGNVLITVKDADGNPVSGATVQVIQKRHAFHFGSLIDWAQIQGRRPDDEKYQATFKRLFNAAIFAVGDRPESWQEGSRAGIPVLEWCRDNELPVSGHFLFNGNTNKVPDADKGVRGQRLREITRAHVQDLLTRYKGLVYKWNASEEMSDANMLDDSTRDLPTAVYQWARNTAPQVQLAYNDYIPAGVNIERTKNMIRQLRTSGATMDALGIETWLGDLQPMHPVLHWLEVWNSFTEFGLPIEISECLVATPDDQAQAQILDDLLTAAFSHPAITGFSFWGFWEGNIFHPDKGKALFRKDWTPRPAAQVYERKVLADWWSNVNGTTDADGRVDARVFLGRYQITVTSPNGKNVPVTQVLNVSKGEDATTTLNIVLKN